MSLIPQTLLSKVHGRVSLVIVPRLEKRSAETLSRNEGVQRLASQLLLQCLTVCLPKLILCLFRWTV